MVKINSHLRALKRSKTYNTLVDNKSIEDFSLRCVPSSHRRWKEWLLAGTALGGISFLALEAIGAGLILNYGFANAFLAILVGMATGFVTGLPITYYCAKYNVDIDLLARGAGFGYLGSTITSLIYTTYTLIFFALEGAIMAKVLQLSLGLPLAAGYLISSLVIIPLAFFGIKLINRLQLYTQPVWIILSFIAVGGMIWAYPESLPNWVNFAGEFGDRKGFDLMSFGLALSTVFALLPQIGEQVDYLRFLPDRKVGNSGRWWWAMILSGPGWAIVGTLKLLTGSYLAVQCVLLLGLDHSSAIMPERMYLGAFQSTFTPQVALVVTTVFVVTCQVKINVTNAYAGSLASSNFFLRIMRNHPGRVIWLVFNVIIAYILMQTGILEFLEYALITYASFAASWIGAMFTDLAILKPLGVSPRYIEFRRAYLYDINPVGFGGMCVGGLAAWACRSGLFGVYPRAFAPPISFGVAILATFCLGMLMKGRFHLARPDVRKRPELVFGPGTELGCAVCLQNFGSRDMVFCPAYSEHICSLCCSLDTRCGKFCQEKLLHFPFSRYITRRMTLFLPNLLLAGALLGGIFFSSYYIIRNSAAPFLSQLTGSILIILYLSVLALSAVWAWWSSIIEDNRRLAEEKLEKYLIQLEDEMEKRQSIAADLSRVSQQQALILENANIGIVFAKRERIIWSNQQFRSCLGLEKEPEGGICLYKIFGLRGVNFKDILTEATGVLHKQSAYSRQLVLEHDNKRQWCILTISEVGKGGEGFILLLDDISQRITAERELQVSQTALKELNESMEREIDQRTRELREDYETMNRMDKMASLGILVSGMAHEINNPVSFIMLNSGVLQRVVRELFIALDECVEDKESLAFGGMSFQYARESVPKLVDAIREGSDRITRIVRNLKDFSRQTPVDMDGAVDINAALDAALGLLANYIKQSTDHLTISRCRPLPTAKGDQGRIEQVIMNLLQNACQALPDKTKGIRIATSCTEASVEFSIEDSGSGISETDMKHIFDPFFTTKRDRGGTGLGLCVSQAIINEHKGTLHIQSRPGEGTLATFSLPVAE